MWLFLIQTRTPDAFVKSHLVWFPLHFLINFVLWSAGDKTSTTSYVQTRNYLWGQTWRIRLRQAVWYRAGNNLSHPPLPTPLQQQTGCRTTVSQQHLSVLRSYSPSVKVSTVLQDLGCQSHAEPLHPELLCMTEQRALESKLKLDKHATCPQTHLTSPAFPTCIDIAVDFTEPWVPLLTKQALCFLQWLAVFWASSSHRLNRNLEAGTSVSHEYIRHKESQQARRTAEGSIHKDLTCRRPRCSPDS